MLDALKRDLRYAARTLQRAPGFTAVAVLTLGLGIGATTAIFSVVDGLLLRALPYDQPDRLVTAWLDMSRRDGPEREWFSYPDFQDYRAEPALFEELGAWSDWNPTLTGDGPPEVVPAAQVTAGMLSGVLRAELRMGRDIQAAEDVPGGPAVAVVSSGFWRDRLSSDPSVLGRTIVLNERPYTVVGVTEEGFRTPFVADAELWTPMQFDVAQCGRGCVTIRTVGRLVGGLSLDEARLRASALADRLASDFPESNERVGATLFGLQEDLSRSASSALWVLLGAVGLVLLMACTSVANLLLARGAAREAELAVRGALGADRSSIFRQLLTESLLLAVIGGALGLFLAGWGTDLLLRMAPQVVLPEIGPVGVDRRVLGFALFVTLGTGLVFGFVPALRASGGSGDRRSTFGTRGVAGGGQGVRSGLVVVQMSVALMLLVGSGLLVRSFQRLVTADLGFDADGVLAMDIALPATRFAEGPARVGFYEELIARVGSLPGVVSVGATSALPLAGQDGDSDFRVEGAPPGDALDPTVAWIRRVTSGYFRTMGIPLSAGREFGAGDDAEAPLVVVVNETLARRYLDFPSRSPIGRRVTFSSGDDPVWRTVIGVVPDTRHFDIREGARPAMYFPYAQVPSPQLTVVARTDGDPLSLAPGARAIVSELDPGLAASNVRPLSELVSRSVAVDRFATTLLALFAALALVLASVGLYGVVSFGARRRMKEMGIRMALGAERSEVRRLVIRRGLALAVAGVLLGLVGSFILTRVLESLLYEIPVTDPGTFAGMALLLTAIALLASWLPAFRASRSDPVEVLRVE